MGHKHCQAGRTLSPVRSPGPAGRGRLDVVCHSPWPGELLGAGPAHDVTAGWGLSLHPGSAPRAARWHHGLAGLPAGMASPPPSQHSSLSLQSSKAVQGLTGLRNLGNTVSVTPALLTPGTSEGQGEPCPFTSPPTPHPQPGISPHPSPHGRKSVPCSSRLVPVLRPPGSGVPLPRPASLCFPLPWFSLLPPPVLHELHPAVPEQHQGAAGLLPAEPVPAGPQQQQPHAHGAHVR